MLGVLLGPWKLIVSWSKVPLPNYRWCRKDSSLLFVWSCCGCSDPEAGLSLFALGVPHLSHPSVTSLFPHWNVSAFFPILEPFLSPWYTSLRWGSQNYVQQVCTVNFTKEHLIFFFLVVCFLFFSFCFLSGCQGVWANFLTALIVAAPCCCSCISAFSRYPSLCVESQDVPLGSLTPHLFLQPPIHHSDCSDTRTGKVHLQSSAGGPQHYCLGFLCLIHIMSPSQTNSGFLGRTAPGLAGLELPRWACPEHSSLHPAFTPHLHNQLFIHANTPTSLQYFL